MEKINIFKGIKIVPNADYFVQAHHLGLEGKVVGKNGGKLVLRNGRVYDLRYVIGLGYSDTPKYAFEKEEISMAAIGTFRKINMK